MRQASLEASQILLRDRWEDSILNEDILLSKQQNLFFGQQHKLLVGENEIGTTAIEAFPSFKVIQLYDFETPRNDNRQFKIGHRQLINSKLIIIRGPH